MIKTVATSVLSMFLAAPISAQVPVYTNKPVAKTTLPRYQITPEEYQSLLAHQFVYVPPVAPQRELPGPTVAIASYTPPVVLQTPFYVMPYLGQGHRSSGFSYGYGGRASRQPERREPEARPRETRQQPTPAPPLAPTPRPAPRSMGLRIPNEGR
jgi:hypothetical protein